MRSMLAGLRWAALLALLGCGRAELYAPLPDAAVDVPVGCVSDRECAPTPATPVCDPTLRVCVGCRVAPDSCPTGRRCDPVTRVCVAGPCRSDRDCAGSPATPRCNAGTGVCVQCSNDTHCPAGLVCIGGACQGRCGVGGACSGGLTCCSGGCVDARVNNAHCGGCFQNCPTTVTNGRASCVASSCRVQACTPGFGDCDNQVRNGCEVSLLVDVNNCGACGLGCGPGQTCQSGRCISVGCFPGCAPGQTCCAPSGCVDTISDRNHCGACGNACPPGFGCQGGRCTPLGCGPCAAPQTCCGDRCTDTRTDTTNCGGCGIFCGRGAVCIAGRCEVGGGCGIGPACTGGTLCCGALCVPVATDPRNCGACGRVCPVGSRCEGGTCLAAGCGMGPPCGPGQGCCDLRCQDVLSDPMNCGACGARCGAGTTCRGGLCVTVSECATCPPGAACCMDRCTDTQRDDANCGACGVRCAAGLRCVAGMCQAMGCGGVPCAADQVCCGDRCVDIRSDNGNCGACGRTCPAGQVCGGGTCACACMPGLSCCGPACVNLVTDTSNCGMCGRVCPPAGPNQTAGCFRATCQRTCNPGFGDCNGNTADGCEANVTTDVNNCGACGLRCRAGQSCDMGRCVDRPPGCGGGPPCTGGLVCCADTCVNVTSDVNHCGGCGRGCGMLPGTTVTCAVGVCTAGACLPGFGDCNGNRRDGCEVTLASDAANCGMCGNVCPAGRACSGGVCSMVSTGSEGAFNPVVNPTFLTPGVHNFTTITVPAGVVVFVAGGGGESGVLDLRASGDVLIDGTIDVSGGPGSQNTITSRSTRQGRAGSGGFTGDPRTAMAGPACEWVAGVSGGNGRGFMGSLGTCMQGSNTMCITDRTTQLLFASPPALFGGGAGVFTGYRAYGAGGGGYAGGAPGALGPPFPGQRDCAGAAGGGGATAGNGGIGGSVYDGRRGTLGQTQCPGVRPEVPPSFVGGGGGGSIGVAAAADLRVGTTFYPGSGGGGGSADYLDRPVFGGTSGGGGGGGALRIWSMTRITINGRVLANGGDGGDAFIGNSRLAMCDPQPGAAGGGGSGGVIFLRAPAVTTGVRARVSAAGGAGGVSSLYATGGAGGDGGLGRVRLSADPAQCTLGGTFVPPLVAACAPTAGAGTPGRAYVAAYPE